MCDMCYDFISDIQCSRCATQYQFFTFVTLKYFESDNIDTEWCLTCGFICKFYMT